ADLDQRIVLVRPHLGQVEGIVRRLAGVGLGHDLHAQAPLRIVAALDRVEEIALMALAVATDDARPLRVGHIGDALHGLEMELHPGPLAFGVDEAVGVAAETMHMAIALGQAAVGKQDRDLMQALGREGPEIPHRRRVAQIALGIALLRADEVGELVGVAHEEDRRVVADQVPVALLRVEFHREAAHVALGVGSAPLAGHGREAHQALRLLSHLAEHGGFRIAADVLGDGERAIGRRALRMHYPFRDALAVEVGVLLEELPVLNEQRPARTGGQAVLIVTDRYAGGRGEHGMPGTAGFLDHDTPSFRVPPRDAKQSHIYSLPRSRCALIQISCRYESCSGAISTRGRWARCVGQSNELFSSDKSEKSMRSSVAPPSPKPRHARAGPMAGPRVRAYAALRASIGAGLRARAIRPRCGAPVGGVRLMFHEGIAGGCVHAVARADLVDERLPQLIEDAYRLAASRRRARDDVDILAVVLAVLVDGLHDALVVELDRDHLLIEHARIEERDPLGLLADVVPRGLVEGAHARRRAEEALDLLLGEGP